MTLPPVSPINIGLLEALDRLGLKGGILPTLIGDVTPVLILGDLSQTITSELVEARRVGAEYLGGIPGTWSALELVCRSPGGLVIEALTCLVEEPITQPAEAQFQISASFPAMVGSTVSTKNLDIGGVPCVSQMAFAHPAADPLFAANPIGVVWASTAFSVGPFNPDIFWGTAQTRIFVRGGETIRFRPRAVNLDFGIIATWRELNFPQGSS